MPKVLIGLGLMAGLLLGGWPLLAQETGFELEQLPGVDTSPPDQPRGLEISPALFEKIVGANQTQTQTLHLRNITANPLPIRTLIRPLTPYEEELDLAQRDRFDASQWLKLNEAFFILSPGEIRAVHVEIEPPPDAGPGGHYASITFQPLVAVPGGTGSVAQNIPSVAAIAFITVPGAIQEQLEATRGIDVQAITDANPINLALELSNRGNIHALPIIELEVRTLDGRVVFASGIPSRLVLPNTARVFEAEWSKPPHVGVYKVAGQVRYGTPTQTFKLPNRYFTVVPWRPLVWMVPSAGFVIYFTLHGHKHWRAAWAVLRRKTPGLGPKA